MNAINEICAYLNNWFDMDDDHKALPSLKGEFTISNGELTGEGLEGFLLNGQYFRIQNSVLNNGVYQFPITGMADEVFNGKIQAMNIPSDVIDIAHEIGAWMDKYGGAESTANSPFNSESFAGYSYNKSTGTGTGGATGTPLWASVYGGRLARWRKFR